MLGLRLAPYPHSSIRYGTQSEWCAAGAAVSLHNRVMCTLTSVQFQLFELCVSFDVINSPIRCLHSSASDATCHTHGFSIFGSISHCRQRCLLSTVLWSPNIHNNFANEQLFEFVKLLYGVNYVMAAHTFAHMHAINSILDMRPKYFDVVGYFIGFFGDSKSPNSGNHAVFHTIPASNWHTRVIFCCFASDVNALSANVLRNIQFSPDHRHGTAPLATDGTNVRI